MASTVDVPSSAVTSSGSGALSVPFLGTYTPRLDDKGRLILPARFRDQLTAGLVMAKGQERCLVVYPMGEFYRYAAQMQSAPSSVAGVRDYTRVLASSASAEVPDRQGRITIPPMLRDYAGLTRDLAVIGNIARVEIWQLEAWNTYLAEKEPGFAAQSEEVMPGRF
ncbi:MAG: division/cell wall cluster transcriptional repressor MraZ [Candidatus Phosphoribacter sp.]|nr:division/cell wall cluster transcriptional repressor MraZ [Actinomycetales bacterium]